MTPVENHPLDFPDLLIAQSFVYLRPIVERLRWASIGCTSFRDSVVNITGGVTGGQSSIRSTVMNMSGGTFDFLTRFRKGSTLNVSGGDLGQSLHFFSGTTINMTGQNFLIDGQPIPDLEIGEIAEVLHHDVTLTAVWLDGTSYSFDLNSCWNNNIYHLSPDATLTVTKIPDPSTGALFLVAILSWLNVTWFFKRDLALNIT